jgi:hypothetical protein
MNETIVGRQYRIKDPCNCPTKPIPTQGDTRCVTINCKNGLFQIPLNIQGKNSEIETCVPKIDYQKCDQKEDKVCDTNDTRDLKPIRYIEDTGSCDKVRYYSDSEDYS